MPPDEIKKDRKDLGRKGSSVRLPEGFFSLLRQLKERATWQALEENLASRRTIISWQEELEKKDGDEKPQQANAKAGALCKVCIMSHCNAKCLGFAGKAADEINGLAREYGGVLSPDDCWIRGRGLNCALAERPADVASRDTTAESGLPKLEIKCLAPWPKDPVVLFLTTALVGYGKLHEDGIRASLDGSEIGVELVHEYLDKESDSFPGGYDRTDLRRLIDHVLSILGTGNVIAVVGPNGIATAAPVTKAVHGFKPQIPVFTESPLSRRMLGNQTREGYGSLDLDRPLYRISSGLDERVTHVANITGQLLLSNLRVSLLREDTIYSREIAEGVYWRPNAEGRVRKKMPNDFCIKKEDPIARASAAFDADFVFYLGTGQRYADIAAGQLGQGKVVPFAGLMNAWAFAKLDPAIYPFLIDLEDIRVHSRGWCDNAEQERFIASFTHIGPDTRDQAFSFDAGLCIRNAWKHALSCSSAENRDYDSCLELMREWIERPDGHHGATGRIKFPPGGGQNDLLEDHFVIHRPQKLDNGGIVWSVLQEDELIELCQQLKNNGSSSNRGH
jgi:hypothetical protein